MELKGPELRRLWPRGQGPGILKPEGQGPRRLQQRDQGPGMLKLRGQGPGKVAQGPPGWEPLGPEHHPPGWGPWEVVH